MAGEDEKQKTASEVAALGGQARALKLSAEDRRAIAAAAAEARWAKEGTQERHTYPKATHGGDRPLQFGDVSIPCYVLDDGTRVLSQSGVIGSLGMKYGTRTGGADRLTSFLSGKAISPYISNELRTLIGSPIKFRAPRGGSLATGYPATILADICDAVLEARKAGALQKQQEHIAEQAEILVRGFARVGIIALVDEATGYQEQREKDELHRLLSVYLTSHKLKWAKRFPDEFYKQLYRLMKWPWPCGVNRTPYVGHLTNKYVYRLLPPGVIDELKKRNPPNSETGRRKHRHHQFLSADIGQPDLKDHFNRLLPVMQLSSDIQDFDQKVGVVFSERLAQIAEYEADNKDDDGLLIEGEVVQLQLPYPDIGKPT